MEAAAQMEPVRNGSDEGRQVEERRDAVQLSELLVQGNHFLGLRRRLPRLLAVLLFYIGHT